MTVFQWLTIPVLGGVLLAEIAATMCRGRLRRIALVRMLVWTAAVITIAFPDISQTVAQLLGIQRGADLVLYAFVLAFLGTTFVFYGLHLRNERQITELVRQLAIERARRGNAPK